MGMWTLITYAIALRRVVENPSPHPDGLHDGGKIVIQQDQVGGFAGNISPAASHGHPDVRGFQRGGVVHAVTGHRHDLSPRLERFHDGKLLLGHHAREYSSTRNAPPKLIRGHPVQLGPVIVSPGPSPIWLAILLGGCRVVARNHDDLDPRIVALLTARAPWAARDPPGR